MIREIDYAQFLRNFKIYPNGQVSFFLGSGASVQAGIPSGSSLVWEFKKEIYCTVTHTSPEKFRDLQSENNRSLLQEYFDAESGNPKLYDPSEYSHYFEKCYSTSISRQQFIKDKVLNVNPSLGHNCLGYFFIFGKTSNIWTTNFDELIEAGIRQLNPVFNFRVFSSANKNSFDVMPENDLPNIYKLHGDYRYDKIKNTLDEVKSLEATISKKFESSLFKGSLIFIGYSGCDESIMSIMEKNVSKTGFLPYGLFWVRRKNSELPERTMKLLDIACSNNENSGIIDIENFDEFIYSCYEICNGDNLFINQRWREYSTRDLPISFSIPKVDHFIKINSFVSNSYPVPYSFDTDISSWKELKEIVGKNNINAALFARKVYCFGSLDAINDIFKKHILSNIIEESIMKKYMYRENSFYTSLLYDLIETSLLNRDNIRKFGKNKYYDSSKFETHNDRIGSFIIFDSIEISLEYINGKYNLLIVPTIFISKKDGSVIPYEVKKTLVNSKLSAIYNQAYSEKIKYWNNIFKHGSNNNIEFNNDKFSLKFNPTCISYGKIPANAKYPQTNAYQLEEPVMLFSVTDKNAKGINQLRGITNYGPIDYSYSKQGQLRHSIKIVILAPDNCMTKIVAHLNKLNFECKMNKDDGYTPNYNNFENIFKQGIDIPLLSDNKRCLSYNENNISSKEILLNTLKSRIDSLSTESHNFSILVIYIPKSFEMYRIGKEDEEFNLHDAIKLYAMEKGIKIQFIEEKSLATYEPCKVMWALSTSLYAKQGGILWRPEKLSNETAFIGISYAYSKEKGISVGCSQLFDSSGTGLRLLLRKLVDPYFIQKNPFMKTKDARQMMSSLREEYYKSFPISKLNRIVIHKTTFFTDDEIKGFTQALEGIEDIELLQIQEYTPWRGIRFKDIDFSNGVYNYPMKRGTIVQLSDNQFLLWTHGSVINNELYNGKGYNFYKGGRSIPMPLMIKRFYGKATGDALAKEIMMLTKMNWNSGDSLYKLLPVTLDFAKVLSRMSKQNEALYDRLYDFRYFM